MKRRKTSPVEIRNRGVEAVAKALGPVGMARFLQQFDVGSGDYTRHREQWLKDLTVKGAVKEIKEQRQKGG